ncbi:unnamed protein product [Phyllotreta striolata]|uniref:Cytochrome P450 monooxygenase n=1 Tax=Phyllotreta striolata TaxID=444603 RepID=A0A9N9TPS7_PHYSR|nr:unnamed protein product [Phyllotreta striolata]
MTLVLIVILLLMVWIYLNFVKPAAYWNERRVFHVTPGRKFLKEFFSRKSIFELSLDAYRNFPSRRFYGSYQIFKPCLVVTDLDLIKQITVKDFDHFTDHFTFFDQKTDPILGQNLFELKGERWKDMRSTLSPAFTSSKMKGMYPFIQETARKFTDHFYQLPEDIIEMDMKTAFSKFTNDIIATCAFGIECDTLKNESNDFFALGSQIANPASGTRLKLLLKLMFPRFYEVFNMSLFPLNITNFFQNLVKTNIEYREKNNVIRPDMIQLLMEAKRGRLKHSDENTDQDTGFATVEESSVGKSLRQIELTDELMTAQALVFFIAGFDTSSTVLSFLAHQLAIDQDVQKKLQTEIDDVIKSQESVSYEDLLKMKYLDQVISEILRRYPPGYTLTRVCVKDYKIEAAKRSEKTFVLKKGTIVSLPIIGIHMDPIFFPNPEKFDPERFNEENRAHIVPGSFMPFGSGPRNCIGSRFALLECKSVIVSLLSKFDILPNERTRIPLRLAKKIMLSSKDGVCLSLRRRKFDN